ncbi:alkaline phosphatase family protein [candidate division KSB1 bacterium]|nr:alkaline phosphatase family protein [candidate division KSB1 bacterium]
MMSSARKTKILLIGIDGATWRIIEPLFQQGKLPSLQRLVQTGSAGILKSIEPMVSPTIWTSIASGKLPEKHGVWDFVVASKNVRCKRIWDIATERGIRVGLCGYMVTWPPPVVNGFVIPGSFSRGPETYPSSLQAIRDLDMSQRSEQQKSAGAFLRLAWQCHQLGVRLRTFMHAGAALVHIKRHRDFLTKFFWKRRIGAQFYMDIFVRQARAFDTELSMYVTMLLDATSHNYWKFMEPERFPEVDPLQVARFRQTIAAAYESTDAAIGHIVEKLADENTIVVVLSDHGFQSVPEAQGRKPDRTVRILPEILLQVLGWNADDIRTFNIRGATFFRDRRENSSRIQEMRTTLESIHLAGSNTALFEVGLDPSNNIEIRLRDEIEQINDLAIRLPDGRVIAANKIIEGDTGGISGDHHPDGVLMVAGPGIRRGFKLERASVLDITPTLLTLMGLPVGSDMDGRVLQEMFDDGFLAHHHVEYVDTWEDNNWHYEKDAEVVTDELKEHLRSLGYL